MSGAGVVIIGGGQGGFQTAVSLRAEGFDGAVTIAGEEPYLPYQRPPLSKGMLLGKQQERHAILRPAAFYDKHNITLKIGDRVTAIDRAGRTVRFASGAVLPYDLLVLATGSRNRVLPLNGATLDGVCYLRTLQEAAAIKQHLDHAERVVVIGGGFIGLEVAAAAKTLGKAVTVLEASPRLMARVVAPAVSDYFLEQHSERGARILLNTTATAIRGDAGRVHHVVLDDGAVLPADLVVIGVGVVPNTELAAPAGLGIGNGITVDQFLQTTDDRIYAIGDCCEFPSPLTGALVRLESVQNAVDQASCVAKAIAGHPEPYTATPWFWTDQYDIHLQTAGLSHRFDQSVTRGDPGGGKFSVFYFGDGKLLAVDSINRPAEHLAARKLIAGGAAVTPEQAADDAVDLKSLL